MVDSFLRDNYQDFKVTPPHLQGVEVKNFTDSVGTCKMMNILIGIFFHSIHISGDIWCGTFKWNILLLDYVIGIAFWSVKLIKIKISLFITYLAGYFKWK